MMVTVIVSCCPQSLRGDLTKWLFEVDTGVYVGRVTTRVGDMLWSRIEDSVGEGHAAMISSFQNEQRFTVRVHNSSLNPVDFEGITLMMKPIEGVEAPDCCNETD